MARGFLYTLSDSPYWLVGVQVLDGVGAGIFGALFPLVVQDLTHGTGRFNVSLGAMTTAWGVGAALSNVVAGWIVVVASYDVAFISLGAVAGAGLALYLAAMPETGPNAAIRAKNLSAKPPPNGGGAGEAIR
jgi:MFS family permease